MIRAAIVRALGFCPATLNGSRCVLGRHSGERHVAYLGRRGWRVEFTLRLR